jgi:NADPH:quinone reductase-like Zn-dependent oxidoreductase
MRSVRRRLKVRRIDFTCLAGTKLKAILYSEYGSPYVLKYEEVEKPQAGADEILIKVGAAAVNPSDWHFMRGLPYPLRLAAGLRKPKDTRLGADVAGQVEALGKNAARFKPGNAVFGLCKGAFAEYACMRESAAGPKPDDVTFEQAASVPIAGLTALQGLRDKGHIQPGHSVLINGAAGGVGTFAVQIAKWFGAEVTAVCSTRNVDLVHSIGAVHVIDYTREDFTRRKPRFDLILDAVGNLSLLACRRMLNSSGIYVGVGASSGRWMIGVLGREIIARVLSPFGRRKLRTCLAHASKEDLTTLHDLLKSGKVIPVIDRVYTLREVPQAIRYLEAGHARGKVVIKLADSNKA